MPELARTSTANMPQPDAQVCWPVPSFPYDLAETTRLLRTGGNDPTFRRLENGFRRTVRSPAGPATVELHSDEDGVEAIAWGTGAEGALARLPEMLGFNEPPWELPTDPVVDRLARQHPGLRLVNTGDVFEGLLPIILQQQVTWQEAAFAWRRLVEELGEPAPGPCEMRLAPLPAAILDAGVDRLMSFGLNRQRSNTILEVAFAASRLERAVDLPTSEAFALLTSLRGIGPWTAGMLLGLRLGRPDAVVVGDLHLPHMVCWALAGEPRGSDERMLELLKPFEHHAFQVVRLLHAARIDAPRRGPRRELRFGW